MDLERRRLLAGLGATVILSACGQSIIFESPQPERKENFNRAPEEGDVVYYHGIPLLLRSNVTMKIPNLPAYLRNSKAAQYGRKVFDNLPDYVIEDIIDRFAPQSINVLKVIFNEFTGFERVGKPNGGEGLVFWPGALTYRGYPLGKDNEPFIHIRQRLEKKPLSWRLSDCDFFTYGAVPFVDYTRTATLRSTDKIIEDALGFVSILKNQEPFEQQNHIAHSAGGIYALEAIRRNMDLTNNLILIDVPIRGLSGTAGKVGDAIKKLGWDDNLLSYLTSLPNDKEYQKGLDKFGEDFRRKGRKLTIIIHEDDPITTVENAMIPGADLVIIKSGIFGGIFNPLEGWEAHGAGLSDPLALDVIQRKVGRNLAA